MLPFHPSPCPFSWVFGSPAGRRNASTWLDRISVQLRKLPPGVAAGSIWLPRPPSTFVGGPATAAHASDADTSASVTAPTPIRALNRLPISFPPHQRCPHSEGTWKPPVVRLYTSRNGLAGRGAISSWLHDRDCCGHALRVGHGKVDISRAEAFGQLGHLAGQGHAGLRPARDFDVAPHELDAASDRLADRLLAREAGGEVLGRVRP